MIEAQFPPFITFILGALLLPFLRGNIKKIFIALVPVFALMQLALLKPQVALVYKFMGIDIVLLNVDKLSLVVGYVYVIIGFLAVLYSLETVKNDGEHIAAFVYVGSSLGVVFAGDFLTFFIFWEIMAVGSTLLVWYQKEKRSIDAGFRYILMHIFGGACLLGGIVIHYTATGSLSVGPVKEGLGYFLLLIGMGLNTAFVGIHTWLPDAYPKSTISGGVFMSVYTTKTGVYALARTFPGVDAVAYMGGAMVLYGVIFALLQNDTRKLLSYHIVSQVGYMVAGVGIGTALGVSGGIAHVFNHILYKGLLFMCMGAVIYAAGTRYLTELGGLAKKMPVTALACIIAAFSISGVPGFNGFVSKGMVIEAAAEKGMHLLELALILGSVGTWLSFLKLTYFVFFKENKKIKAKEVPIPMQVAMLSTAFLCILFGVYPQLLFQWLPYQFEYHPYSLVHFSTVTQLLAMTAVVFFVRLVWFEPHAKITHDLDYIYRKLGNGFIWLVNSPLAKFGKLTEKIFFDKIPTSLAWFSRNPVAAAQILTEEFYLKTLKAANFFTTPLLEEKNIRMEIALKEKKALYPGEVERRSPIGISVLLATIFLLIYFAIYVRR